MVMKWIPFIILETAFAACLVKTNREVCYSAYTRGDDVICAHPSWRDEEVGLTAALFLNAEDQGAKDYVLLKCLQGLHLADKCEKDSNADWPTIDAKM